MRKNTNKFTKEFRLLKNKIVKLKRHSNKNEKNIQFDEMEKNLNI